MDKYIYAVVILHYYPWYFNNSCSFFHSSICLTEFVIEYDQRWLAELYQFAWPRGHKKLNDHDKQVCQVQTRTDRVVSGQCNAIYSDCCCWNILLIVRSADRFRAVRCLSKCKVCLCSLNLLCFVASTWCDLFGREPEVIDRTLIPMFPSSSAYVFPTHWFSQQIAP